ncbi:MAG: hypothetical protein ACR2QE_10545 [Acidimicrobiales bacterium]
MRRASLRLAAVAAALVLLLAACGSDDPETGTDGSGSTDSAAQDGTAVPGTDETSPETTHGHDGEMTDVSDLDPAPSLELEVLVDDVGGFNVHAVPANHDLAPEAASTEHVAGEGHMHLYVDGEKVSRFYNEWLHVGDLEPGDHEFRVELSANDHTVLAVDGVMVDQTVTVTQPEREGGHSHSPDPVDVSALDPAPSLEVTITDDPKSGFNLRAVASNYTLTPENVNGDNVDGEGHMHIYVDGEKITRLYGEWYHVPDKFGEGEHEVTVELSANNHASLEVDGEIVEASATFTSTTPMDLDSDEGADHDGDADHDSADHDGDEGADHDDAADGEMTDMVDADHTVEITYANGAVVGGPATIETGIGDVVTMVITSDIDEEVHVHGIDVTADLVAGEATEVTFTSEIPGQFEIELEGLGQLLATLVTS